MALGRAGERVGERRGTLRPSGLPGIIPAVIDFSIPEASRLRSRPGIRLHRSRHQAGTDRILRDGLWVSTARRALPSRPTAGLIRISCSPPPATPRSGRC